MEKDFKKLDLLLAHNDELMKEAKRIFDIIYKLYQRNEKINMTLCEITKKYIKSEYFCYAIEIEYKIEKFIPEHLAYDTNNIFISKEQALLNNMNRCINYYKNKSNENMGKNPIKCANKLAEIIIKLDKENKLNDFSLTRFVPTMVNQFDDFYYDSTDIKIIIFYLHDIIKEQGYEIKCSNPLKLEKISY